MLHYLIELAILLLVAYFAGALAGCLLRKLFGGEDVPKPVPKPVAEPVAAVAPPAPAPVVPTVKPAAPVVPVVDKSKVERPKGIAAARGGKADKLQRLSGVGPKNVKILQGLGVFHFDQIAAWTAGQVSWVDDHLKFNGRIKREEWTKQARLLADGKEAEFAKHFGTGGVRGRKTQGNR